MDKITIVTSEKKEIIESYDIRRYPVNCGSRLSIRRYSLGKRWVKIE